MELGGEVLKVAAKIRTNSHAGARRPLGGIPNILFTPWEPTQGNECFYLGGVEETVPLDYVELPSLAEAEETAARWQQTLDDLTRDNGPEWQIRVASKSARWAKILLEAVRNGEATFDLQLQALRVNDIMITGMNVETFFETGLYIKAHSPFQDTFVLGYTNGSMAYLPRAEDYPEGGWKLNESYALPDQLPQFYPFQVIALRPDSEQRAIDGTLKLIKQLSN
jgi:hypothetical protein